MKVYMAQTNPIIGNFSHNAALIIYEIEKAKEAKCELIVFPELALSGYNPEDLLLEKSFIKRMEEALSLVVQASDGIAVIVGCVRESHQSGKPLCNSACVIENKEIVGFQDKYLLPTYDVFDEWRYFEPAKSERIWQIGGKKIGITICEDIWFSYENLLNNRYKDDPLEHFETKNLDLLINISASPYAFGRMKTRVQVTAKVAKRLSCPIVLVNQVGGQDGLLFDGSSFAVGKDGELLANAKSFHADSVVFDTDKQKTASFFQAEAGDELFHALVMGVRDYFQKFGFSKVSFGLSGGIDSAVVAAVAKEALGKENVEAFFLPSRFTSEASREDAYLVAKNLGIKLEELSIEPAFEALLKTLNLTADSKDFTIVEENLQSRVRGTLLMALSNKRGSFILNTGNKSEIAMGYTTLYGDSVGSLGVLGDMLKRQVIAVARYINKDKEIIPKRVLEKAPTAELRFNQKDSDTLPEYPILDTIVDAYIVQHKSAGEIAKEHGYREDFVQQVITKIHANEYKRRQLPPALRVSDKAFSIGRKVPIVSVIQ